jgi:glucose-1-phosphate adenylyltransferase
MKEKLSILEAVGGDATRPRMERMILARELPKRTVALVLAGGRGSRLMDLTDRRAKPAVYFGGKFRIIDFALSNCLNSGIRRMAVLTQYKSHSLLRHLQRGWNFLRGEQNEFIDLLPAQQRVNEAFWYRGTPTPSPRTSTSCAATPGIRPGAGGRPHLQAGLLADAAGPRGERRQVHRGLHRGAAHGSHRLGVMHVDADRKITAFLEKPEGPARHPGKPDKALGSMGIYVFNAEYLYSLLEEDWQRRPVRARLRQERHPAHRGRWQRAGPSAEPVGGAGLHPAPPLLARRGHGGCLLGGQPGPGLGHAGAQSLRPRVAVWTYQEQLPPAKFVPERTGSTARPPTC